MSFTSHRTSLILAALAWGSQVARSLIDATEGFHMNAGQGAPLLAAAAWYTLFMGGWAYAMHTAAQGSRRGLVGVFALNLLFLLAIPVGTFLFFCTGECYAAADLALVVVNWLNLVLGALAAAALGLALWGRRAALMAG